MTEHETGSPAELNGAIDRYGADLSRWPDRELAARARVAALSDRAFRARLDSEAALERHLAAARRAEDAAITTSGAAGRIAIAAMASVRAERPRRRRRFMAAAAAILLAAGIGGIVDSQVSLRTSGDSIDVVSVDPLVFGPLDTDVE